MRCAVKDHRQSATLDHVVVLWVADFEGWTGGAGDALQQGGPGHTVAGVVWVARNVSEGAHGADNGAQAVGSGALSTNLRLGALQGQP